MEEILYEIQNKQGMVTSSIKTWLPKSFNEFISHRFVAVLFFILNPKTNEYIEAQNIFKYFFKDSDKRFIKNSKSYYDKVITILPITIMVANIMFMRQLQMRNIIFALTKKLQLNNYYILYLSFQLYRVLMKYYIVPRGLTMLMNKCIIWPMHVNRIEYRLKDYDFNQQVFSDAYNEVLQQKKLVLTSDSFALL